MDGFTQLLLSETVSDVGHDGVIVVTDNTEKLTGQLQPLKEVIEANKQYDKGLESQATVIVTDAVPSKRLIYSATGPINRDQDDVRRFQDAASNGIARAINAGCKKPLLITTPASQYEKAVLVSVLGALQKAYSPLEIRETGKEPKLESLAVYNANGIFKGNDFVVAGALEKGRVVARDIGGSDPERMAAPRIEEYLRQQFQGTCIEMTVIEDVNEFKKEFPLLAAVNRAANSAERHRGRVIFLEYNGAGPIEKTLFLVGKGITYDTGGADIKAGGIMAGMHRDKCGAAAVAGFMKMLSILKPAKLRVVGGLAVVRNSVGEESYVADEIITSRAGVRVRVGNTDAEGRMVMADVLCKLKEQAVNAVNPQLFTIATLTGHAIRAVGPNYSIILENGPARRINNAQNIQAKGDEYGDPFEITTIRRDDYEFHKGKSEYEDVLQANNLPSTLTNRGHQGPAAFLILASGLDKHGVDSEKPLPYSHIDIAGSSGPFPGVPTGAPIVALAAQFVLN